MIKQVIILRTDLNMRKGKMAAQAAHASMKVLIDRSLLLSNDDQVVEELMVTMWPEAVEWLKGQFTKIVVGCGSGLELTTLYTQAQTAGLPCSLIEDAGNTEFHGIPTKTAVAIGPAQAKDIDLITKHLKLL